MSILTWAVSSAIRFASVANADPQPASEVLPLNRQSGHDLANLCSGFRELLGAGRRLRLLSLDEDRDHVAHLGLDEPVDVLPHGLDITVQIELLQTVLFKLLELYVEDAGNEFAGHVAGPLLGFLLAAEGIGAERGLGSRRCTRGKRQHRDGSNDNHSAKSPPPHRRHGGRLWQRHRLVNEPANDRSLAVLSLSPAPCALSPNPFPTASGSSSFGSSFGPMSAVLLKNAMNW